MTTTLLPGKIMAKYRRFDAYGVPVYIFPEGPDWFVPSDSADALLLSVFNNNQFNIKDISEPFSRTSLERLVERIAPIDPAPHEGRNALHTLSDLKECWFHITNRCNMACTHCMFASNAAGNHDELPLEQLYFAIEQASALGCRVFFFTGGEPFIYPHFTAVCDQILAKRNTHIVIMTNAKNIQQHEMWFDFIPDNRVHLQVSIDGDRVHHDSIRGTGSYDMLLQSLDFLKRKKILVTLSMSVTRQNVLHMTDIVETASKFDVAGVHFMWLFKRGRAKDDSLIDTETLTKELLAAYERAKAQNVSIDNIEALRSQVFTIPGTRFDLTNIGWESITVGPDGGIYPSPALVGMPGVQCGHISDGLKHIWHTSPVLKHIREASVISSPKTANHPLRFLIGGGDIDHSYHAAKTFVGDDPYLALYTNIALFLISEHARNHKMNGRVGLRCRMGEYVAECGPESEPIMFTHSNCVQAISNHDSHTLIKSFYSHAAETTNEEILNPVSYGEENIAHIPEEMRVRSYGCGSPVLDCDLEQGQSIADLGSGTGIECFIAAKIVGPDGNVFGIDMSDSMLSRAEDGRKRVVDTLGYNNVVFRKGLLEKPPLDSNSLDFIISNCVVNLTADKRSVFEEIYRVLKPGGMLCISDIVTMSDIPLEMKYNEQLRGECLGGAMQQQELFSMIEDIGFEGLYLVRRYEYRRVKDHPFYSVTYKALKPNTKSRTRIMYRGPYESVTLRSGEVAVRGRITDIKIATNQLSPHSFFIIDETGTVTNVEQQTACGIFLDPSQATENPPAADRHVEGCIICNSALEYSGVNHTRKCHVCGNHFQANAICTNGHFVCDSCHSLDARGVTLTLCHSSTETDPITLFTRISSHRVFPMHGPEYHSLVPAVIVAAYRNAGGSIPEGAISTAIERGSTIAGGSCAFLGVCGAALGAGTALSIILKGTPLKGTIRQMVQTITVDILQQIASFNAARCCRRDCLIALTRFVELSGHYLPLQLKATKSPSCIQCKGNEYCIGTKCPWWFRGIESSHIQNEKNVNE